MRSCGKCWDTRFFVSFVLNCCCDRPLTSVVLSYPAADFAPIRRHNKHNKMMSSRYEVVDEGHVGGREQFLSEWKTIRAVFHNFADLPFVRGRVRSSPVLKCHGSEWKVQLYPGGSKKSSAEEVFVSLFLLSKSCSNDNKIRANLM